jgi:carbon monoxide dehydrogenase subunit G
MHEFRPVGLDFADSAPARFVVEEDVALPRQAVWDAFADAATWRHWFPHVEWVKYEGKMPPGVGTTRISMVAGCLHDETMVAWDEPRRWGYIINKASEPLAKAQIELTEFEEIPTGTRVRWILACDPLEGLSYISGDEPFETFLARLFAQTMRNLEAYLKGKGAA